MIGLFDKFRSKEQRVPVTFVREHIAQLAKSDRLVGIRGSRGSGKTTLLLQYAKLHLPSDHRTLYVSLDDLYFAANTLYGLADEFVKSGGQTLLLDEVHRYPNWSQELKNIYDDHVGLRVVFTGSSILHLDQSMADLSRRAVIFRIQGLSFREFLSLKHGHVFEKVTLHEILAGHSSISQQITAQIRPIEYFNEYMHHGYYPYFTESADTYLLKLAQTVNQVIDGDLPYREPITTASLQRIRKLMYIIATSVPFTPHISKLSEQTGLARNTVVRFIHLLTEADLLASLSRDAWGMSILQKPDKIYLHHPNLMFALAGPQADVGTLRETFFINQLSNSHKVRYPEKGDFLIDDELTFEIGGKNKTTKQLNGVENAFIAMDGIEHGHSSTIPLWLFGFLY